MTKRQRRRAAPPPRPIPPPLAWQALGLLVMGLRYGLALFFLLVALPKLRGLESAREMFAAWGYPALVLRGVGLTEAAGAVGLALDRWMRPAAFLLAAVMLGALLTHLGHGEAAEARAPATLLVLLGVLGLVGPWVPRPRGVPPGAPEPDSPVDGSGGP